MAPVWVTPIIATGQHEQRADGQRLPVGVDRYATLKPTTMAPTFFTTGDSVRLMNAEARPSSPRRSRLRRCRAKGAMREERRPD